MIEILLKNKYLCKINASFISKLKMYQYKCVFVYNIYVCVCVYVCNLAKWLFRNT